MKSNVSSLDRVLRVLAGLAVFGAGYHYHTWWGLVGLVPFLTGLLGFCPAYRLLGLNSCPFKVDSKR